MAGEWVMENYHKVTQQRWRGTFKGGAPGVPYCKKLPDGKWDKESAVYEQPNIPRHRQVMCKARQKFLER